MKKLAAILLVGLLTQACGGPDSPSGADPNSNHDYDGTWELTEGRGPEGQVPVVEGSRITLIVDGKNLGGIAACNSYGSENTQIEGNDIEVQGFFMTEMGCEEGPMRAEFTYMAALQDVRNIERAGDVLTLTGPKAHLIFSFVPPPPTASLTDVEWELVALIAAFGPDGTASSAHPASLLLSSDGSLTGSTGCRKLTGRWIERGDEILATEFGAEGHCSEELRSQDDHIVGVLGDGFTVEIEGQSLTIRSSLEGRQSGLIYRAEDS